MWPWWRSFAAMVRAVSSMGDESFILKVGAVHRTARFCYLRARAIEVNRPYLRTWASVFGAGCE
jgi:hypothetical protein